MKIILSLALLILFFINSTAYAEERASVISVNGDGVIETSPDRATISIGVISRSKNASQIQSANAKIVSDVIKAVTALGVDRKNIRTGNYSFHQYYKQDEKNRRVFDGYEINNTISVMTDNLDNVGKIIDAALSNGANSIDSLQFGVSDKTSLQGDAIRLAVRDARAKAEIVAQELGKQIIGIRSISVNSGAISAPRYNKLAMAVVEDAAFETPIESGTLSCSANVHVEFEISK